jgi:hypothetical protein
VGFWGVDLAIEVEAAFFCLGGGNVSTRPTSKLSQLTLRDNNRVKQ